MLKSLFVAPLCLVFAAACGSGASVGTVDGTSLSIKETISYAYATTDGSGNSVNEATVVLGDFTNICADILESQPAGHVLALVVADPTAPVVTGTYTFDSTDASPAAAGFYLSASQNSPATSGTITYDYIGSDGSISGSYSLTFDSGNVHGAFSATPCTNIPDLG